MPRIQKAADARLRRVILIKFVAADRVAFHADAEHLALHRGDHPLFIVIRQNFVEGFFQAQTGSQPIRGNVLIAVGNPDIDETGTSHRLAQLRRDFQTSLAVVHPEFAGGFVRRREGKTVFHLGMRKKRRVKVDARDAVFLGEFQPRLEILIRIRISVHFAFVRAENGIARVQVEPFFAGH